MQFTPQQLAGAGRYAPKTRIGNWNEDTILDEYRMKEYRLRKQQGSLATFAQQQKFVISNQKVPHSHHKDGLVRYGDYVIIQHGQTSGTLASDVWEEVISGSCEYTLSVSSGKESIARNTFRIVSSTNQKSDEVLKYGEPFRIMCNESLLVDEETNVLKPQLYLKSCIKTDRLCSRLSVNQMVSLSKEANANSLWVVGKADSAGAEKFLASGTPVHTDDAVSFIHKMTGQSLYADSKYEFSSDFGQEFEVCCLSTKNPGRRHNLVGEFSGTRTVEILAAQDLPQNSWRIVLSKTESNAKDSRNLPSAPTIDALLSIIRATLVQKGFDAFVQFRSFLVKMDEGNYGTLDREDVKWALKDNGIKLRDDQIDIVLDYFDQDHTGIILLSKFLSTIRGNTSSSRIQLIKRIFESLLGKRNEVLNLQIMIEMYNPKSDPRVHSGDFTAEDALNDFRNSWSVKSMTSPISEKIFTDYYQDVSATIESDDFFERLVKSAWPGVEASNSSSRKRRALVSYKDGTQEIVELSDSSVSDVRQAVASELEIAEDAIRDVKLYD